jgi:hypothetical protein
MTDVATTVQAKRVLISIAGEKGADERPVDLAPGTTVRDVLQALKLQGFALSRPGGGMLNRDENLFALAEAGQKFFASPADVEAGEA